MTALEKAIAESKEREARAIEARGAGYGSPEISCTLALVSKANNTWEPKWREMVEYAKYGFEKILRSTEETEVAHSQACLYLNELERLAKEGLSSASTPAEGGEK